MEPENLPPESVQPDADKRRGLIERHRTAAVVLSLLALLGAGTYMTWYYWPGPDTSSPTHAWYTCDDGKTRFEDSAERVPPFEHEGRQAVRLHLFSCDGGKTTFVGYLQKLPEEAFKKYRDRGIDPATVDDDVLAIESGWLMKRPGDAEWITSKGAEPNYTALITVHCPDGRAGDPLEVFPPNPKKR